MAIAGVDTISVRSTSQGPRAIRAWPHAHIIDTLLSVGADVSVTRWNGAHSLHTFLILNARVVDVVPVNATIRFCAHVV